MHTSWHPTLKQIYAKTGDIKNVKKKKKRKEKKKKKKKTTAKNLFQTQNWREFPFSKREERKKMKKKKKIKKLQKKKRTLRSTISPPGPKRRLLCQEPPISRVGQHQQKNPGFWVETQGSWLPGFF